MHITDLILDNFRNFAHQEIHPGGGFNLFIGRNAQGKSNLLEAAYALGLGRSYKTSREEEILAPGAAISRIGGNFHEGDQPFLLEVIWEKKERHVEKAIRYNSHPISRLSDFIEKAPMVLLTVDDMDIIRGVPENRRRLLDLVTGRLYPAYILTLRDYRKYLEIRNIWLRTPRHKQDSQLGEVYREKLVALGSEIIFRRIGTLDLVKSVFEELYAEILSQDPPSVRYRSSIKDIKDKGLDAIKAAYEETMIRLFPIETRRGYTLAGPHRDDLDLKKDGRSMKSFSSMGEIRGAAAILKLAEVEVISRSLERQPIVLVDDCLNEFDPGRVEQFLAYLTVGRQVFYASTRVSPYFNKIDSITPYLVKEGTVTPCSQSQLKAV